MAFTLEDRQAVQDLLVRYAYALDVDCTEDEFLAIFTDDAILDGPVTGHSQGQEGLRAFIRLAFERRGRIQLRHVISNFLVTGDDREARVRAYFVEYMTERTPPSPKPGPTCEFLFTGSYDCLARKVGGEWKLARRTVHVDTMPGPG